MQIKDFMVSIRSADQFPCLVRGEFINEYFTSIVSHSEHHCIDARYRTGGEATCVHVGFMVPIRGHILTKEFPDSPVANVVVIVCVFGCSHIMVGGRDSYAQDYHVFLAIYHGDQLARGQVP